jgi:hypothetical protein
MTMATLGWLPSSSRRRQVRDRCKSAAAPPHVGSEPIVTDAARASNGCTAQKMDFAKLVPQPVSQSNSAHSRPFRETRLTAAPSPQVNALFPKAMNIPDVLKRKFATTTNY